MCVSTTSFTAIAPKINRSVPPVDPTYLDCNWWWYIPGLQPVVVRSTCVRFEIHPDHRCQALTHISIACVAFVPGDVLPKSGCNRMCIFDSKYFERD